MKKLIPIFIALLLFIVVPLFNVNAQTEAIKTTSIDMTLKCNSSTETNPNGNGQPIGTKCTSGSTVCYKEI